MAELILIFYIASAHVFLIIFIINVIIIIKRRFCG